MILPDLPYTTTLKINYGKTEKIFTVSKHKKAMHLSEDNGNGTATLYPVNNRMAMSDIFAGAVEIEIKFPANTIKERMQAKEKSQQESQQEYSTKKYTPVQFNSLKDFLNDIQKSPEGTRISFFDEDSQIQRHFAIISEDGEKKFIATNDKGEPRDSKKFILNKENVNDTFVKAQFSKKVATIATPKQAETKFAGRGELVKMFENARQLSDNELNSQQKKWREFGRELGLNVVWIDANKDLKGAVLSKTFYHEQFHILSAINPKLHDEMLEHFRKSFTAEQLDNYRKENQREDLTDDEVIEEILCDNFESVQRRAKILQDMSKDNPNLLKKFIAYLKNLADKFVNIFRSPEGGMTREQRDAFIQKFNSMAGSLKDIHGNKIFTTYKGGKELKFANGENLPNVPLTFSFAGEKALTADKDTLKQAKKLEKQGKNRDEIYQATGWFKGKDNRWRFEIPDNLDKIDFTPLEENNSATLGEIYDNPELY